MVSIREHTARDWGLDSPRGDDWARDGLCRDTPDRWSSEVTSVVGWALHMCLSHCPVLAQCDADARSAGPGLRRSMTWGGVRYNTTGQPSLWQPVAERCERCPPKPAPVGACLRCGGDVTRPSAGYCTTCTRAIRRDRKLVHL